MLSKKYFKKIVWFEEIYVYAQIVTFYKQLYFFRWNRTILNTLLICLNIFYKKSFYTVYIK